MNSKDFKVVIVGIGGYGANFVDVVLHHQDEFSCTLVGAIAPHPDRCYYYPELLEKNIPIFHTIEEFFADRAKNAPNEKPADLAILSTPIFLHKSGIIDCLSRGMDVLCEKPICATIDDVKEIIDARNRFGGNVTIGYQWSHSQYNLNLKKDILDGKFGKIKNMRTLVLWPRDFAYYGRGSGWAGKLRMGDAWTLDSVASNATAHYLHNMFFITGPSMDRSADITDIEVETYRANDIETYDTCALRGHLDNGAPFTFTVSHALKPEEKFGPEFVFEFEKGTLYYTRNMQTDEERMFAKFADGTDKEYGAPEGSVLSKMQIAKAACLGEGSIVCGPEAASTHTKCINAITECIPQTPVFPEDITVRDEERVYIKGLADIMHQCYETGKLPSELGVSWAKPAVKKDMRGYNHFSM